ncbi:MAG: hypothetical protein ACTSUW_04025 [Candidatus Heimdallarchaeota archaeon]
MKNKKYFTIIIALFISSLFFGFLFSSNKTLAISNEDNFDLDLQPNLLGEIDFQFSIPFGIWEIEYLNGLVYGVDGSSTTLRVYDAVTGESTDNHTIPFPTYGLTTDGTNLYTTIATGAPPNGTILKLDLTGNEISRIHIPLTAGILNGLAWDGTYLWAFQNNPASFLRIDYNTGVISRNLSAATAPHGMTWYDDMLWVENYGIDQTAVINPLTGATIYAFPAPYHFDTGLANNGTHFIQSSYAGGPFVISFSKIPSEPGDIFTKSISLSSNIQDITYDGSDFFWSENGSSYIAVTDGVTSLFNDVWDSTIDPVGVTIMDGILIVSTESAPYNLYSFAKDGTMLANNSALGLMINSLANDGTYLWAMGSDGILYKLDTSDFSIVSQYTIGNFKGITYDYVNDVIWAVSKQEHKVKYFDIEKEQLGNNVVNLTSPISPSEYGLTFDGEFLVITSYSTGGHYYRILPCELDAEPPITPTPTPTPSPFEGLFGLSNLYENLLFVGFGIVGTAILSLVIALVVRKRR